MKKDRRTREREERIKKRKKKQRRRIAIVVAEFFVLMILIGVAYMFRQYDQFQTVQIDADDIKINEGVEKEGYMTIALYGGDSREGALEKGAHTDTIIVASIDNKTKEVRLASIYRDTLTRQEDGKLKKANNGYFVGGPASGINLLNTNLDLSIEDYVTVDFKALVNAIDLLGGIELPIEDVEVDPINQYLLETAKVAEVEANLVEAPGVQLMDGAQAVTYARIRSTAGGDYRRTERQRLVIEETMKKAQSAGLKTINDIIETVFPQISTSLSLADMLMLAVDATEYSIVETFGFPENVVEARVKGAGSAVVANDLKQSVEILHGKLYPGKEYTTSNTVLDINKQINEAMAEQGITLGMPEEVEAPPVEETEGQ